MSISKVIFELFLFYLLYKLVFDFIIPVFNTTKQVKKQFGDMQNKMREQQEQMNRQQSKQNTEPQPRSRPAKDDYIEYEEVSG